MFLQQTSSSETVKTSAETSHSTQGQGRVSRSSSLKQSVSSETRVEFYTTGRSDSLPASSYLQVNSGQITLSIERH